jgi:hypothetical protein
LDLVETDPVVLNRAAQPMPAEPGAPDAIHLATALLRSESKGAGLVMAARHAALAPGARAPGLAVVAVPRPA